MSKPTLISIDYDFFIPHGMYEDVKMPNGSTMPGMLVFDWQMDESRTPLFDQVLWSTRAANFTMWGLDIQRMTAPTLDVQEFATELSIRMGGNSAPAYRADSHGWAAIVCRDYAKVYGPLSVVNFDAHHDLGYNMSVEPLDPDKISCESWALLGLQQGWIADYTIVYPDWLGLKEWHDMPEERRDNFKDNIAVMTWSEWKAEIPEPVAIFACRSSSWVPPWHDPNFTELVDELGYSHCLDCEYGQHNSAFDTCGVRDWDWEAVEKDAQERVEMFETLKTLNSERG